MLYRRFWLLDALLIAFISTSAENRKLIGEHLPSKSVAKQKQEYESFCLGSVACRTAAHCLDCDFPTNCSIGSAISVNCSAPHCDDLISGNKKLLVRNTQCHFCWQLDHSQLDCEVPKNCSTNDVSLHLTICRTKSHVLCAGSRTFYKKIRCHWTAGYSWRKALFLSVTLGGFGVDRFYLGHWKSAIGKLFSFGGLGLWTLLDIVLIGIGYIQPADESLYI